MSEYEKFKTYLESTNFQERINKLAKKYKNKKIIIYGAGVLFQVICDNYDLSGLNIVAVSDKKFKKEEVFYTKEHHNYRAISPFLLEDMDFDLIIVANYNPLRLIKYLKTDMFYDTKITAVPFVKKGLRESFKELFKNK